MKVTCIKCVIITIFLFTLFSCEKSENFEFLRYETGGFGSPSYTFTLKKDRSFEMEIQHNPFNETIDSSKVGKFYGKIAEDEMLQIKKSLYKVTRSGYDYNNPEFILDAGIHELYIKTANSEKVFQTHHATEDFKVDIIEPFHKIAEKQVKFKIE
ncbi:hypothetical protein [Chryseobacterium sp.]|uniref:hypothetical protein n=1 Tax=Chryseobacterium sp. TaxID=1871047 RepID=UPI0012A9E428|nr:hypothetical protein [Chryseobacterium sp.]QFG52658.1 hypothetical protein F7R58_03535 [Chryseobacterium sp.]